MALCPYCHQDKPMVSPKCPHCNTSVGFIHQWGISLIYSVTQLVLFFGFFYLIYLWIS